MPRTFRDNLPQMLPEPERKDNTLKHVPKQAWPEVEPRILSFTEILLCYGHAHFRAREFDIGCLYLFDCVHH